MRVELIEIGKTYSGRKGKPRSPGRFRRGQRIAREAGLVDQLARDWNEDREFLT